MAEVLWNKDVIREKLKLFQDAAVIDQEISGAIVKSGLEDKNEYNTEEMMKILEALISYGGYVAFVARNLKINLICKGLSD
ncbi:hypothetical protein A2X44_04455 [candidate division CPR3 bacterium GWF2_35_18]|uniref:Uncharacterized protein n=1 Tax=candidate division CPR3 bacterium GW2011_GWF2_35_18 TaxID=1618350 RepID=A0A0G0E2F5_UNCC3|nr:MAG: hypothetical protein UR67_C0007G0080 [candidate division CPR3 bacterium GW2011_GWF2_35_18]OGB62604.1 MAG: hypothetical protein A2X44_04455 [candidate division CPR3 bacterium GWF2_35_18]OGB65855.1 MAG: hypothetical protein A2250_01705 [candidate division CPR3 bacterium RIFOXYA2_FULL_35_13]OGB76672.1 MAG: hypothetical protein A2476_03510 [candidate division CPR3 bacterium RIFOXYC2_FULL_35_7]OGB78831.1 MAG: hypothetical protein A2296_05215 [candidate division CPR3 bacterium RIFOXYB2_FULL_3